MLQFEVADCLNRDSDKEKSIVFPLVMGIPFLFENLMTPNDYFVNEAL